MPNTEEIIYDNKYGDQKISDVEAMANANVTNIGNTYDDMIVGTDTYYQELKNNVQTWADKQTELQKEQGELAVKQLEQQQAQAEKDYTKEQSAAYADYTKQTQKHGVNAEQMAAQGFAGSGYSESAQVAMYTTYQNRVATAKASFEQVKANYDISIAEAKLQNNAALAEIAFEAMQKQLELSLEGFQYKNTLLIEKTNQITNAKNTAWGQYMDVLDQIYKEDSLAESARQHQLDLDEKKRQFDAELAEKQRQYDLSLEEEKRQYDSLYGFGEFATPEVPEDEEPKVEKEKGNVAKAVIQAVENWNAMAKERNTKSGKVEQDSGAAKDVKKQLSVDRNSLKAIGLGGANEDYIKKLVKDGYIEEYEEDGKIKYRKTPLGELLM